MTPLDSFKLGGFQASVTLVAEVAAGVMFCGIPSGTVGNKMTSQSEDYGKRLQNRRLSFERRPKVSR